MIHVKDMHDQSTSSVDYGSQDSFIGDYQNIYTASNYLYSCISCITYGHIIFMSISEIKQTLEYSCSCCDEDNIMATIFSGR